jgi:hypothetical protein
LLQITRKIILSRIPGIFTTYIGIYWVPSDMRTLFPFLLPYCAYSLQMSNCMPAVIHKSTTVHVPVPMAFNSAYTVPVCLQPKAIMWVAWNSLCISASSVPANCSCAKPYDVRSFQLCFKCACIVQLGITAGWVPVNLPLYFTGTTYHSSDILHTVPETYSSASSLSESCSSTSTYCTSSTMWRHLTDLPYFRVSAVHNVPYEPATCSLAIAL